MSNHFTTQHFVNRITRGWSWRQRLLVVIWAAPVLFLAAAVFFAGASALYVARSVAVEGLVVERYEWPGETVFDRGAVNYEPIFTYDDAGQTRRASVGSGHSSFDVAIGDTAVIRVIPGSAGNVRIDTWQGLWFMPAMLSLFTLASIAVALPIWLIVRTLFDRRKP